MAGSGRCPWSGTWRPAPPKFTQAQSQPGEAASYVQCLAYDDQYNAPRTDLELIHCITPDSGFLTLKRHFKIVYEDGYKKYIDEIGLALHSRILHAKEKGCERTAIWLKELKRKGVIGRISGPLLLLLRRRCRIGDRLSVKRGSGR